MTKDETPVPPARSVERSPTPRMMSAVEGNLRRFSGFADLYDRYRPSPPARLGPLLVAYAGGGPVRVVDIGSGSGLSTRWAAQWADTVVGVEPNDDMRRQAEQAEAAEQQSAGGGEHRADVRYRAGTSDATGLPDGCADVVTVVQAMHWMEPVATLAEIARLLRPGGVLAVIDADWPPVTGLVAAEVAWERLHRRLRVFDARVARSEEGAELRRSVIDDGIDGDADLRDERPHDPHRNRLLPDGVRSWSKGEHLDRIGASGWFGYHREVLLDEVGDGGAERFAALLRSQGSYQQLRRSGLSDDDLGVPGFEADVAAAFATPAGMAATLRFVWRVRLGVRHGWS